MEIDTDTVWALVPELSKAEALVLLGFARCWAQGGDAAEYGRLDPDEVASATGVALATVGATLRSFTLADAGRPVLVEPVYYLAAAEGRTVPDRRVGYAPAAAIRPDVEAEPFGPDDEPDVPSFVDVPEAEPEG